MNETKYIFCCEKYFKNFDELESFLKDEHNLQWLEKQYCNFIIKTIVLPIDVQFTSITEKKYFILPNQEKSQTIRFVYQIICLFYESKQQPLIEQNIKISIFDKIAQIKTFLTNSSQQDIDYYFF